MDTKNIIAMSKEIFNFALFRLETGGLEITSIGVGCPKCGNRFGVKIYKDMQSSSDLLAKRFTCQVCEEKNEKIELDLTPYMEEK